MRFGILLCHKLYRRTRVVHVSLCFTNRCERFLNIRPLVTLCHTFSFLGTKRKCKRNIQCEICMQFNQLSGWPSGLRHQAQGMLPSQYTMGTGVLVSDGDVGSNPTPDKIGFYDYFFCIYRVGMRANSKTVDRIVHRIVVVSTN